MERMDQSPKVKISVFIQGWVVENIQILREKNQSMSQCGINVSIQSWMGKESTFPCRDQYLSEDLVDQCNLVIRVPCGNQCPNRVG